ncbi:ABC transporter substrate-binding protein, partial [Dactylosporangium sucinum]
TPNDKITGDENWAKMVHAFEAAKLPLTTSYAARGYLYGAVIAAALESCNGCTGDKLREAILSSRAPTDGITPGDISFTDDNHQGVKALPIYRRNNGVEHVGNFDIGTGLS